MHLPRTRSWMQQNEATMLQTNYKTLTPVLHFVRPKTAHIENELKNITHCRTKPIKKQKLHKTMKISRTMKNEHVKKQSINTFFFAVAPTCPRSLPWSITARTHGRACSMNLSQSPLQLGNFLLPHVDAANNQPSNGNKKSRSEAATHLFCCH